MRAEQGARQVRGAGGAGVSAGQGLRGAGEKRGGPGAAGAVAAAPLAASGLSSGRVPALGGGGGARGGAWRFPPFRRPSARRGRWRRGGDPGARGIHGGEGGHVPVPESSKEGWIGGGSHCLKGLGRDGWGDPGG